jgi:hypothetical protein
MPSNRMLIVWRFPPLVPVTFQSTRVGRGLTTRMKGPCARFIISGLDAPTEIKSIHSRSIRYPPPSQPCLSSPFPPLVPSRLVCKHSVLLKAQSTYLHLTTMLWLLSLKSSGPNLESDFGLSPIHWSALLFANPNCWYIFPFRP